MPDLRYTIESVALRLVLSLPPALQRFLVRRPLVVEEDHLATELQLVLALKRLARIPDFASFPVPRARVELLRQQRMVGGRQLVGAIRDLEVDGATGPMQARLYIPSEQVDADPAPTLLFIHGGGWIYGDLESHDQTCRFLAERSGVQVLAIDYRLAPEHPFPAALEDCKAALRWMVDHADEIGADPQRLGVGGDSAGGNLAAVLAVHAAQDGIPLAHQLLIYPGTDFVDETKSKKLYADLDLILTRAFIDNAKAAYVPDVAGWSDPDASPLRREEFPAGLAPAHVVTAGFDPLRDEGEAYADLLEDRGVPVTRIRYPSLVHGFIHMVGYGREPLAATGEIADRVRTALG